MKCGFAILEYICFLFFFIYLFKKKTFSARGQFRPITVIFNTVGDEALHAYPASYVTRQMPDLLWVGSVPSVKKSGEEG